MEGVSAANDSTLLYYCEETVYYDCWAPLITWFVTYRCRVLAVFPLSIPTLPHRLILMSRLSQTAPYAPSLAESSLRTPVTETALYVWISHTFFCLPLSQLSVTVVSEPLVFPLLSDYPNKTPLGLPWLRFHCTLSEVQYISSFFPFVILKKNYKKNVY